jgi:hypothetical protein
MKRKQQQRTYMKMAHKLALLAAIGLTTGGLITYAQSDSSDPSEPPSGVQGRPGPGTLLLNLLDKYDANHDGVLDQTELAKLRSDIQAGNIQPPRHRGPGGPPGGNDAGMHQPPSAKDLIKQFDTDNDGKLDEAELTAMLKFLHEHRPMHGPGGQGGPGGPGGPPPGDSPPQQ